MKISEIQEMILNDSKINMSAIDEESNRAISLHAKYLGLYQNERQIHFLLDLDLLALLTAVKLTSCNVERGLAL